MSATFYRFWAASSLVSLGWAGIRSQQSIRAEICRQLHAKLDLNTANWQTQPRANHLQIFKNREISKRLTANTCLPRNHDTLCRARKTAPRSDTLSQAWLDATLSDD